MISCKNQCCSYDEKGDGINNPSNTQGLLPLDNAYGLYGEDHASLSPINSMATSGAKIATSKGIWPMMSDCNRKYTAS